jgi:hypothetical protein
VGVVELGEDTLSLGIPRWSTQVDGVSHFQRERMGSIPAC